MKQINKQSGVTLIELMIAVVIGSVIMLGVGTVYSSSKRSAKVQEEFSRLQENGRYAMNYIARYVRGAGYAGCASYSLASAENDLGDPDALEWNFDTGLEGYEYTGTAPGQTAISVSDTIAVDTDETNWLSAGGATLPQSMVNDGADDLDYAPLHNSDILVARTSSGSGVEINTNNNGAQIFFDYTSIVDDGCGNNVDKYSGLCPGDVLVLSNCKQSVIFQATSISLTGGGSGANNVNVKHAASGDPGNRAEVASWQVADRNFGPGDELLKVSTKIFYVGEGTNGPALFLREGSAAGREVVEGVENMQVLYGEDTDADNVPDYYVAANNVTNFADVVAVRISILLRSINELAHRNDTSDTYLLGGSDNNTATQVISPPANTPDKRMRRVMTQTIKLRNRALNL